MDGSTTTKASIVQPAVIGGLVMGVLSALPLVNLGNLCCCLWLIVGGVVASYLLQQNQTTPIAPGDGALVGLLAGAIGACVSTVLSIPIGLLMGPMQRAMADRVLNMPGTLPPGIRDILESSSANAGMTVLFTIVGFIIFLFLGAIFSTLGGLLGALIFKKSQPTPFVEQPPTFGA